MITKRKKLHGIAFFALCIAVVAPAIAATAEAFRWDSKVQRGQLANGLNYYIVDGDGGADQQASKQVALQLLVRVGSLDEKDDQSGVAHMVEHMVFHATRAHPEGLKTYMESLGWRIGTHYNAQTNFERTLYFLTAPQSRVDAGLGVLAEIAGGAQIPADGLERERQIILEEWRTKLGVRERMDRQRRAMLREGSLYPQRPTIGTEASIRQQPAENLRKFYGDWYRPGNMALLIVGKVDAQALKPAIERHFGALVPAALPARNSPDPALRDQLRITRLQDAESGTSQVGWVTRFTVDQRQDEDGLRARIIDRIAERSLRALVRDCADSLPAGVSSLNVSKGELGASTASLGFAASVAVDAHRAGMQQILLLQERVRRNGLDAAVIAREIADVQRLNDKGPQQRAARDLAGWLQLLGEAVQAGRALQDPLQKQAQISRILAGLRPADINARVLQWVNAPDRALFMLAPGLSALALPSQQEVLAVQKKIATEPLPALLKAAPAATTASLPQLSSDGDIVRQDELGSGVQRWTLGNGDVLVWQQTAQEQKEQLVRFAAHAPAGYRMPGAPAWQWQLAAQLGRDADLPGQAPGELARWAAQHKVKLSQQQTATQLSYTAQVPAAQLEDLLRLYAARQLQSEIGLDALGSAGQQLARQAARRPDSAGERAGREMSSLRYGELPLDGYPDLDALKQLMTEQGLQTVRGQWLQLRRQPVTYFVSGPLEAAQVQELAGRYLAGIPRQAAAQAPKALVQRPGYRESRLAIGIEPQGSVRAEGSQAMQWSPERAMRTAIVSRIIYRSLRQELREKEAGIYRLNYKLSLDPQHHANSELSFTAAPERLDVLWASARRVLERLPQQLDTAMLQEEIARMRSDEAKRVSDSATQFNRLQLSYTQFGDARYLADSQQLASALTVDSMRAFASEFRLARDMAVVKVLPKGEGKGR
ncbi:insulinase family protein [Janthinobacterium sp. RB2R34]|uniref:M16 family metallopeptidase n=1 Tax=Janthinobacterium sp. RB2R34 TaxID=3424193 RepID=UPI003F29EECF